MVLRVLRGKNREKKMIWNPDQLYLIMDLNLRIFSVEKQPIVDGSRRKIVYDTLKKKRCSNPIVIACFFHLHLE